MKKILTILAMSLYAVSAAHASILITVGDHDLLPNTANQTVDILISTDAADAISGAYFRAEIGNGVLAGE